MHIRWPALLVLTLAAAACAFAPEVASPAAAGPTATATKLPTSPPLPTATLFFEQEALRNGTYHLPLHDVTVTLAGGKYETDDAYASDYVLVELGPSIAFGDLNADGLEDAVVSLSESGGELGQALSFVVISDVSGTPAQLATLSIDSELVIGSMRIVEGELRADVHGYNSGGYFQANRGFRLYGGLPVITYWKDARDIYITAPDNFTEVTYPLTVSGTISPSPFPGDLKYRVYSADNRLVANGTLTTDNVKLGDPGSFSVTLDLASAGVFGLIRVEVIELDSTGTSPRNLESVMIDVH